MTSTKSTSYDVIENNWSRVSIVIYKLLIVTMSYVDSKHWPTVYIEGLVLYVQEVLFNFHSILTI